MTPYEVIWEPDAEHLLTDLWIDSVDRNSITADQAEVDQLLARDPFQHGRLVSEGLYGIRVGSLFVNFTVAVDARIVNVTWVRLCR
jgi:hypothetical protein